MKRGGRSSVGCGPLCSLWNLYRVVEKVILHAICSLGSYTLCVLHSLCYRRLACTANQQSMRVAPNGTRSSRIRMVAALECVGIKQREWKQYFGISGPNENCRQKVQKERERRNEKDRHGPYQNQMCDELWKTEVFVYFETFGTTFWALPLAVLV